VSGINQAPAGARLIGAGRAVLPPRAPGMQLRGEPPARDTAAGLAPIRRTPWRLAVAEIIHDAGCGGVNQRLTARLLPRHRRPEAGARQIPAGPGHAGEASGRLSGPRCARGQRGAGRIRLGASWGDTNRPTRQTPAEDRVQGRATAVTSHGWNARRHAPGPGWFVNRSPNITHPCRCE
jgi:hypothetical protein